MDVYYVPTIVGKPILNLVQPIKKCSKLYLHQFGQNTHNVHFLHEAVCL